MHRDVKPHNVMIEHEKRKVGGCDITRRFGRIEQGATQGHRSDT